MDAKVTNLLNHLYADAAERDPQVHQAAQASGVDRQDARAFFHALREAYLPVSREFGKLLYTWVRAIKATTVVEFGTSFGLSTLYLAAALRDNGGGRLVTTEFEAGKAERARQNLAEAGLADLVEIRVGDAMETLKTNLPGPVDLIFLDGAKHLYLDVLKLLQPKLRRGGIVASDNTDHEGLDPFLAYVRSPTDGYLSSALLTARARGTSGHEVSIRL